MGHQARLDELLDLFDADPDWDSSDDDDPFKTLDDKCNSKSSAKPKEPMPEDNEITFEQMFGTPIQKKSNPILSKSTDAKVSLNSMKSSLTFTGKPLQNDTQLQRERQSTLSTSLPILPYSTQVGKQAQGTIIVDPFTKCRLLKTSVQLTMGDECPTAEGSLQGRNIGMQQISLSALPRWHRGGGNKDKVQFWTTGILARKPPGLRKSSKGNDYSLWEIIDLSKVEEPWTVFLFGSAANAATLNLIPVGTLVDLQNPTILENSAGVRVKLSVSNANQVRRVGQSVDFGYCQAKKKDGNDCTAVVNTFECPVCIHHASAELRKSTRRNSGWSSKRGKIASTKTGLGRSGSELGKTGIMVTDFGALAHEQLAKRGQSNKTSAAPSRQLARMELQDPSNTLKRNSVSLGNHSSISFKKETNPLPLPEGLKKSMVEKKVLVLDPLKTRHLTDKDRHILEALSGSPATKHIELPNMLTTPNAGSKNFLKYLNRCDGKDAQAIKETITANVPEPERGTKLTMTRETMLNMQKALNYVKENGAIPKRNPNKSSQNTTKRKLTDAEVCSAGISKRKASDSGEKSKPEITKSDEFAEIIAAKSSHAGLAEELAENDYFEKHERKEAVENKLLNTFKIPTTAVMCRECKYVALSSSDLCKEKGHQIRLVKATKRFFKCKFCGSRAMSLDRLPKRPCSTCKSTSWLVAPVGRERIGPPLASESLSIRGDEEKFLGSTSGKLYL